MVAPQEHAATSDGPFEPYQVVRELRGRAEPVYLARHSFAGGKPQLFVIERFAGAATSTGAAAVSFVKVAKRIASLMHSNVPRVREVLSRGADLVVVGHFVDGERLRELWLADGATPLSQRMPLEVSLRVILDVLAGLGALHSLRDAKGEALDIVHGEVSPANVVVGLDGTSRVLHAVARCAQGARIDPASAGYVAPEILAGGVLTTDVRADVYSAGVLLWEALSGAPLFTETEPSAIRARVDAGLPRATLPEGREWAKPLIDVAARALSAKAGDRFLNVTAMSTELRKIAALKVAPVSVVVDFVRKAAGDRIKSRRAALEGIGASPAAPASSLPVAPSPAPPVVAPAAAPAEVAAAKVIAPPVPRGPRPPPAPGSRPRLVAEAAPLPTPTPFPHAPLREPSPVPEASATEAVPEPFDAAPSSKSLPSTTPTIRPPIAVPPPTPPAALAVDAPPEAHLDALLDAHLDAEEIEPDAFLLSSPPASQRSELQAPPALPVAPLVEAQRSSDVPASIDELPGVGIHPEPIEQAALPDYDRAIATAPGVVAMRAARRRRAAVAFVASLGLGMAALVGWRMMHRGAGDDARPDGPEPTAARVTAVTTPLTPTATATAAPTPMVTATPSAIPTSTAVTVATMTAPPAPKVTRPPAADTAGAVRKPKPPPKPPAKPKPFHPTGL